MNRPAWHDYFLDIAKAVSTRATCDRLHVGCVITSRDDSILATGYNGALSSQDHCDDVGHLMVDGHCVRTLHAEQNAITQAARNGVALVGSIAYVTALPCVHCIKLLVSAGVTRVVFDRAYGSPETVEMVKAIARDSYVTLRSRESGELS